MGKQDAFIHVIKKGDALCTIHINHLSPLDNKVKMCSRCSEKFDNLGRYLWQPTKAFKRQEISAFYASWAYSFICRGIRCWLIFAEFPSLLIASRK